MSGCNSCIFRGSVAVTCSHMACYLMWLGTTDGTLPSLSQVMMMDVPFSVHGWILTSMGLERVILSCLRVTFAGRRLVCSGALVVPGMTGW